jgi:tripartite-type tricarboxylate transporter receptor subunit TctC
MARTSDNSNHQEPTTMYSRLIRAALVLGLATTGLAATAQSFPTEPVKLVVPLTAGSGADTAARLLAQSLSKLWGQPVVVDNRPGAGGLLGTGVVVNANPDGQTLLLQSAGYAANPAVFRKLPYDASNTLIDVGLIGSTQYVLVTSPTGPYKTFDALVQAAKDKPGDVTFGSVGIGSSTHFAAEYFSQAAGVSTLHIPYRGGPEVIKDVVAGRIGFAMASLSTALGHIQANTLVGLGVAGAQRSPSAPEIPTLAEQGLENADMALWFGLWAPAGTPPAVVKKINDDLQTALQDADLRRGFAKVGMQPQHMTADQFARFVKDEMAKFQQVAKKANIEPQ